MKISLNWIKNYIDLSEISVEEIVSKLTMAGLEVEDYADQNVLYKNLIVGNVIEVKKHPNANKLTVCKVNDGSQDIQVICGAPNVSEGQKVVLAIPGAIVPKTKLQIAKVKMRGVESSGMICSADELGLSDDHSGILVLENEHKPGTPFSEALGLNDVILEIAVTPNRPDALSHIGVARDLSALFNRELKLPKIEFKESETDIHTLASVEIEDKLNCPRYSSRVLTEVSIKPSPEWLQKKIKSIGLRPINNIVDVTNFVLHETGQPLHAFDLDLLAKHKIVVKSTAGKNKFTTLDSKVRELPENTLMICDAEKYIAIAGVMGGENSEVTESTKNILIESAYFNPAAIRRTSKYLGLSTDASYHFERATDPSNTIWAAERAAQLIAEVSGGKVAKGTIDIYPNKISSKEIKLRLTRITRLLGYDVAKPNVIKILNKLAINVIKDLGDTLLTVIPTFRPDIEREVDLIEEIARISGYDKIPTISKINITLDRKKDDSRFHEIVRDTATGLGLYEIINNPLQSHKLASLTGTAVGISNPLSNDMNYLRTSLIPGALTVVSNNIKKGEKNLALFEIGNLFNLKVDGPIKSFEDFSETTSLILLLTGMKNVRQWYSNDESYDFYSLKGLVNSFNRKISLDNVLIDSYNADEKSFYDNYFEKSLKDSIIGAGGQIKKNLLEIFDIEQNVFCFEYDLGKLKDVPQNKKLYSEPLKYPKVSRDMAFVFNKDVTFESVRKFVIQNGSELLKSVTIFDLFESKELGDDKKSMAFNLEYFDLNRTLTEEEVDNDFKNLITLVTKKFDAQLRGN